MTVRLDISIGPVQGFVSQSRRTRDLWGSSYLLSFLSAHAMHGAREAGGNIVQPVVVDDRLVCWVAGERIGDPPSIGTVPNHFVVEVDGAARSVAEAAVRSFEAAWKNVADVVWRRHVEHAGAPGNGTKAIWDRQVGGFWEVMWTAGPSDGPNGLLARRKYWRSHRLADEPGDKCTVMPDLQELSGHVRRWRKDDQDEFWACIDQRLGSLDRREDERLCAIAAIKRLFPKVAAEALGWPVDASHWPSTVYVAAVPWIRRAVSCAPEQSRAYAEAVEVSAQDSALSEQPARFGIDPAASGDLTRLDANYFHRGYVENDLLCPLADGVEDGARLDLSRRLEELYRGEDDGGRIGPPLTFYAMLLADGDRLGRLLGKVGGAKASKALRAFTERVPCIVDRYDGVTVYTGGDDVLAILPVSVALLCAERLRCAYEHAFAGVGVCKEATLSAAVVMAHMRLPLGGVLREAHRLLDAEAKDGNGRNSLAAAVLKPGGPYCQWVTAWNRSGAERGARVSALESLNGVVALLERENDEPGVSSSLVYRLRDLLVRLCGWNRWRPGQWGGLPESLDVRTFLRAEIRHNLAAGRGQGEPPEAGGVTDRVWKLLQRSPNGGVGGDSSSSSDAEESGAGQVGIDALLLARFMADPEQRR